MHTHHPRWARSGVALLLAMILTTCVNATPTLPFSSNNNVTAMVVASP